MIERLALASATLAVAGLALWGVRRRSPLHLFTLLVASSALIGIFYPVVTMIVEPSTWRRVDLVTVDSLARVQWNYLGLLVGFLCAMGLMHLMPEPGRRIEQVRSLVRTRDLLVPLGLVGFGAALYAVYISRVGFEALTNRQDYAEKYLLSQGLGVLSVGIKLMIAGCLWAEAGELGRTPRRLFRLVGVGLMVWSVAFLAVRTNFVILVVGYAYLIARERKWQLARIRPAWIALLLVGYMGLEGFSLLRGVWRDDLGAAATTLAQEGAKNLSRAVGGSELGHPFITAMEVMEEREPGELRGSSYLEAFEILIPQALNPDRPTTLAQEHVWTHYTAMAEAGGGTAFSSVAEAWLNFGPWFGPWMMGLVVGLLVLLVERRALSRPDGFVSRLAPTLVFAVAIFNRADAAGQLKQLVQQTLPLVLLWLAAEAVWLSVRGVRSSEPTKLALPPATLDRLGGR